jgi:hypothetical protein
LCCDFPCNAVKISDVEGTVVFEEFLEWWEVMSFTEQVLWQVVVS